MKTSKNRIWVQLLLALIVLSPAATGLAQSGKLELQGLEKLGEKAVEVNDVTLDGSVLQMAINTLKDSPKENAAKAKNALQGLKGIYVKNFEFEKPNEYSAADVEAIRSQLTRPGWSRIVTSHNKRQGEQDEIYVFKENDKIAGMAILVAEPKELTVVNIVGFIEVDKLGDLAGQFGIPEEIKDKDEVKEKPEKPRTKLPVPPKPDKKEDAHDDQDDDQ
jgi:hypothetical protein